jgi:uncharacterized membrane protein YeaQ/YmgE (transglycosylase-associated protein family)
MSIAAGTDTTIGDSMIHIIGQALIGLVIGVIAKLLLPGADPGGWIVTAIIGVVGGWFGGWIGRALGWYKHGEPAGFAMSIVGAMALLLLYRFV